MASASGVSQVSQDDTKLAEKINTEVLRRFKKAKWITISKLYYTLSRYGRIYGGAVRDYITRINAADSYYAYCKENGINADANYNEPGVHPESFADRNLMPNDIDIFITKEQFDKLIKTLESMFKIQEKPQASNNYFFKSCELLKAALTHEKWVLNLFNFNSDYIMSILFGKYISKKCCELSIDFVIIGDSYLEHYEYVNRGILYPPFGNPDFDVNLLSFYLDSKYILKIESLPYLQQLYSSQSGIDNPLKVYETNKIIMDSIITNIKNKQARPIFPIRELYTKVFGHSKVITIEGYRITKMLSKKYKLVFYNTVLPSDIIRFWSTDFSEKEATDSCSICHELFTNGNRAFNACSKCPRKMHLNCFRDFLEKENASKTQNDSISCIYCKKIAFVEYCPCELVNFLIGIADYIGTTKTKPHCSVCRKWYTQCTCWFLNCTSCSKTQVVPALLPVVPTGNLSDEQ